MDNHLKSIVTLAVTLFTCLVVISSCTRETARQRQLTAKVAVSMGCSQELVGKEVLWKCTEERVSTEINYSHMGEFDAFK